MFIAPGCPIAFYFQGVHFKSVFPSSECLLSFILIMPSVLHFVTLSSAFLVAIFRYMRRYELHGITKIILVLLVADDPEGVLAIKWQTNTILICFHLSLQAVTEKERYQSEKLPV
jgi:hypothetical protein